MTFFVFFLFFYFFFCVRYNSDDTCVGERREEGTFWIDFLILFLSFSFLYE